MFEDLNYKDYCVKNSIHKLVDIDLDQYGELNKKKGKSLYETVDPNNKIPFPPELDDLIRLHFLVTSRKVMNILEFGVGKSTVVFADAIRRNKENYESFVKKNLRRSDPFKVYSIENSEEWIEICKSNFSPDLISFVEFYFSEVEMTTFNGRVCTMYEELPNVCPDLIYLDAPDQFSVKGEVRGISTRSPDRVPMSADILLIEPFLLPGTLIIVDGRTANARFLKNNLQRDWKYNHFVKEDIHIFELVEPPLGLYNEKQIEFCLSKETK